MSYTPTVAVINTPQIAQNILTFIAANQEEAILWANNGTALKPIKKFSDSVADRNSPVFPAMFFSDDNDSQDFTSDVRLAVYRVTFEVIVQNQTPDEAVRQARVYCLVVKSLIANMEMEDLLEDVNADSIQLADLETGFLQLGSNEMQTDFGQTFQVRATFSLTASSFS